MSKENKKKVVIRKVHYSPYRPGQRVLLPGESISIGKFRLEENGGLTLVEKNTR